MAQEDDQAPARIRIIDEDVGLVYAIGDVHGRADLLTSLLDEIAKRADGRRVSVVFLGDLVDRGPQTSVVLDRALATFAAWPDSLLCLGNHDDWFLRFLSDDLTADELDLWLDQGGAQTLSSYDVTTGTVGAIRDRINRTHRPHATLLRDATHLAFWRDFAFVHAGVDPSTALTRQTRRSCLWLRAPFLNHIGPLERIVVHGHSPQKPPRPHVTENRISLDTGAFFTGTLTAMEVDQREETVRFLSTSRFGSVGFVEAVVQDRGHPASLRPACPPSTYERTKKGAAQGPPNLAGVSGHEKPDAL